MARSSLVVRHDAGQPGAAADDDQHLAKFHRCLEFAATRLPPDAPARLVDAVSRLETLDDVRLLADLAAGLA